MAIIYVNSGASGTNAGTSWTNAYTSLGSTTGAAAGDEVRVHNAHSQSLAGTTWNWSNGTHANPVRIICVDKDNSDVLSTGATITFTSGTANINGNIVVDGLTITGGAAFIQAGTTSNLQEWFNSTISPAVTIGLTIPSSASGVVNLTNCVVDLSSAADVSVGITVTGVLRMSGGVLKARSAGQTSLLFRSVRAYLRGVDIQNTVTNLASGSAGLTVLSDCKLPSFTNIIFASPNGATALAILERCVSGTITSPTLGLTGSANRFGALTSTLSRYRTGGANDGVNANEHSWSMVSNANTLRGGAALESPPLVRWVAAGSYTVTVYVAGGATLQDDEFWAEIISPNEVAPSSTTTQGKFQTSRLVSRGTATNLATDGVSTWNGTGVGTQQKITFSIAPALAGPVTVRCFLAKASATVYLDPMLDIT